MSFNELKNAPSFYYLSSFCMMSFVAIVDHFGPKVPVHAVFTLTKSIDPISQVKLRVREVTSIIFAV